MTPRSRGKIGSEILCPAQIAAAALRSDASRLLPARTGCGTISLAFGGETHNGLRLAGTAMRRQRARACGQDRLQVQRSALANIYYLAS